MLKSPVIIVGFLTEFFVQKGFQIVHRLGWMYGYYIPTH